VADLQNANDADQPCRFVTKVETPIQVKVPGSIEDIIKDPQNALDVFRYLNLLLQARIQITQANAITGIESISASAQNVVIPIPVQMTRTVPDPSGGSTVDAECRASMAALLSALRSAKLLPS
jgi:hypothetical protein